MANLIEEHRVYEYELKNHLREKGFKIVHEREIKPITHTFIVEKNDSHKFVAYVIVTHSSCQINIIDCERNGIVYDGGKNDDEKVFHCNTPINIALEIEYLLNMSLENLRATNIMRQDAADDAGDIRDDVCCQFPGRFIVSKLYRKNSIPVFFLNLPQDKPKLFAVVMCYHNRMAVDRENGRLFRLLGNRVVGNNDLAFDMKIDTLNNLLDKIRKFTE